MKKLNHKEIVKYLLIFAFCIVCGAIGAGLAANFFYTKADVNTGNVALTSDNIEEELQSEFKNLQKILTDTSVIHKAKPFFLTDGRKALLVAFYDSYSGRNQSYKLAVIMPDTNIAYWVRGEYPLYTYEWISSNPVLDIDSIIIMDLDNDGVSEVIYECGSSGNGGSESQHYIANLSLDVESNCVNARILYSNSEFDNDIFTATAMYIERGYYECVNKELHWEFKDINGDGVLDLVERIHYITEFKMNNKKETSRSYEIVHKYVFYEDVEWNNSMFIEWE
ncbi:MAG: hypothetical protein LBO69_05235 [Ignavibacteria bacterium]|jgi:hypothetical protein|nr:hypothetical protein [Ignavibacteria bacterium]